MPKSTPTTKAVVGKEAELILNSGDSPYKSRTVKVPAVDNAGLAYSWSFRGTARDDFAPWSSIHLIMVKQGPSSEFPKKVWKKKFKKVKPVATGLKVVGKLCEIKMLNPGWEDETRVVTLKGCYVTALDDKAIQFVHNRFGQIYVTVVGLNFLVNVEFREKGTARPPGSKK